MITRGSYIAARYRAAVKANSDAEEEARTHRALDPLEIIKRFLQTKGIVVYSEAVLGGAPHLFVVGTLRGQSARDLTRKAQQLGFQQEKKNGTQTRRRESRSAAIG